MNKIQNIPEAKYKRVVVVGGGFAGLKLVRKLFKSGYQVVLLDKNNYHQFQPLLYQVATAGLEPSAISFPFRKLLQNHVRIHFRIATVQKIDMDKKEVTSNIGCLHYDYLVLSAGLTTNFFGMKNIASNALPMKSVSDALYIRNTILSAYEAALNEEDSLIRQAYLSIVIVGGGPTGVELAGAVAEMKNSILPKDYPELDFKLMNIYLYEASPALLNSMSANASKKSEQYLEKLGVIVRTGTHVTDFDGKMVSLSDGSKQATFNMIWSAGVTAIAFEGIDDSKLGRGKRILVDEFNRIVGIENVFVLGDMALMTTKNYPEGHPQVAQPAIQQAANLGHNLKRIKDGKAPNPFRYKDKGSLATVGKNLAVADLGRLQFQGFFAWMLWSFVHVMSIIGVKNKLFVLINWSWNYFTYDPALRLLIRPSEKKKKQS